MLNLRYAAYSCLNEYLRADKPCMDALNSEASPKAVCEAMSKMAAVYNINRTLWRNGESCRLEGARRLLMEVPRPLTDPSVAEAVDRLSHDLGAAYPRQAKGEPDEAKYAPELLSAASKFLWMRFKDPIVMYDRFAWQWIQRAGQLHREGSYADCLGAWRKSYADAEDEIVEVCAELVTIRRFTLAETMPEQEFRMLVGQTWFKQRVFDHAIVDAEQKREEAIKARRAVV